MILNWYSSIAQGQGYSGSSEKMVVALERLGFDVRVMSFGKELPSNRTEEGKKILNKPFQLGEIGICYGFPNAFDSILNKHKIGFTMFETDTIPSGKSEWAGKTGLASDQINKMDALFVPSQHNKELFESSGVKVPVHVVRLGIDPEAMPIFNRPKTDKFTFLMLGTLTLRKNPAMAINAFLNLYKDRDDVQLILKTQSGTLGHISNDGGIGGLAKNLIIVDKLITPEELLEYYKRANCFLFPSRGEGFGLPPLEAMATGLPTILSDNTGLSEFCNPKYNYPVKTAMMSKALRFPKEWGNVGNWYEPDYATFKRQMKKVFENQEASKAKGMASAKWVRENFTYDHTALRIKDLVEQIVGHPALND